MLKWPSGYRALRKIVNSFTRYECNNTIDNNVKEDDVDYEGGEPKETQIAPMMQFYPDVEEPTMQAKTGEHSE